MPPATPQRRPEGQQDDQSKTTDGKRTCAWCEMPVQQGEGTATDDREEVYHVRCLKAAESVLKRLRMDAPK
jgi:hypothetical protein